MVPTREVLRYSYLCLVARRNYVSNAERESPTAYPAAPPCCSRTDIRSRRFAPSYAALRSVCPGQADRRELHPEPRAIAFGRQWTPTPQDSQRGCMHRPAPPAARSSPSCAVKRRNIVASAARHVHSTGSTSDASLAGDASQRAIFLTPLRVFAKMLCHAARSVNTQTYISKRSCRRRMYKYALVRRMRISSSTPE